MSKLPSAIGRESFSSAITQSHPLIGSSLLPRKSKGRLGQTLGFPWQNDGWLGISEIPRYTLKTRSWSVLHQWYFTINVLGETSMGFLLSFFCYYLMKQLLIWPYFSISCSSWRSAYIWLFKWTQSVHRSFFSHPSNIEQYRIYEWQLLKIKT